MPQPYLFFEGSAREALDFYQAALGAEIEMVITNAESPEPPPPGMLPPGSEDKILHSALRIDNEVVMLSDGMCSGKPSFEGFSLSITVTDAARADQLFNALAEGGQVQMPLGETFFSPRFGMLQDRFGVSWMINMEAGNRS